MAPRSIIGNPAEIRRSHDRAISQIPEYTCSISHKTPFRTEMCTFLFWNLHCGIWMRCILGYVKLTYYHIVMTVLFTPGNIFCILNQVPSITVLILHFVHIDCINSFLPAGHIGHVEVRYWVQWVWGAQPSCAIRHFASSQAAGVWVAHDAIEEHRSGIVSDDLWDSAGTRTPGIQEIPESPKSGC